MRVAVIGAGWAGCAAALTLAEAGCPVSVFEAAAQLGGRARALGNTGSLSTNPNACTTEPRLDNGQHILLGAYSQTLALVSRLHARPLDTLLLRLPLELASPPDFLLRCPRWPAPFHLLAGVLRARGLSWRSKLATLTCAQNLLGRTALPRTVIEAVGDQPRDALTRLWEPLCLAALNTPIELACAASFRRVLQGALGGKRADSDLLLPRIDLGELFPVPATRRITVLGGEVNPGRRVTRLQSDSDTVIVNDDEAFTHVIVAVAPWHAAPLLEGFPALAGLAARLRRLPTEAIATGYLHYPAPLRLSRPMLALEGGPGQFAFDRGISHGTPGVIAVVASAASHLAGQASSIWLADMAQQLLPYTHGLPASQRGILEKRATWACVPNFPRPPVETAHAQVFLAGDYTAGPYPATLESATRSGVQSAHAVLRRVAG